MSTDARRTLIGAAASLFQVLVLFMRRRVCALRGHDLMMEFAPKRLSLRCAACGANTPGWELDVKMRPVAQPPRIRVVARTAPAAAKSVQRAAASPAAASPAADHATAA